MLFTSTLRFMPRKSLPQIRTIYSWQYIWVEKFMLDKTEFLKERPPTFQTQTYKKTKSLIENAADQVILSNDINRLLYTTSRDDVDQTTKIVRDFVVGQSQEQRQLSDRTKSWCNRKLTLNFLSMCHTNNDWKAAWQLMSDDEFLQSLNFSSDPNQLTDSKWFNIVSTNYLQLLYNHERYLEVLDFYTRRVKKNPKSTMVSLALASCYKLATPEAFAKADQIFLAYDSEDFQWMTFSVVGSVYALVLLRQNKIVEAHELASIMATTTMTSNIRLHCLTQLKRYDEALELLQGALAQMDSPKARFRDRPEYSVDVVKELASRIEAEAPVALKEQAFELYEKLDQVAQVTSLSVERLVLEANITSDFYPASQAQFKGQRAAGLNPDSFSPGLRQSLK